MSGQWRDQWAVSPILPQIVARGVIEVDGSGDRPLIIRAVKLFERLVRDESGATAVEYSMILGGIAAAIIVMIYVFGDKVNNLYNNAQSQWP
jgi:Flp pilus assembly pilin Flp